MTEPRTHYGVCLNIDPPLHTYYSYFEDFVICGPIRVLDWGVGSLDCIMVHSRLCNVWLSEVVLMALPATSCMHGCSFNCSQGEKLWRRTSSLVQDMQDWGHSLKRALSQWFNALDYNSRERFSCLPFDKLWFNFLVTNCKTLVGIDNHVSRKCDIQFSEPVVLTLVGLHGPL